MQARSAPVRGHGGAFHEEPLLRRGRKGLVEEPGRAYNILERAGFKIKEQRDVLVIDIKDIVKEPGSGGSIFRKFAQEGINIDLIYLAENNRLIIGVDDLKKARAVL